MKNASLILISSLLLAGCGASAAEEVVTDGSGRRLSGGDAVVAKLSAEADSAAATLSPEDADIARKQEDDRRLLRLRMRKGYVPTDEEKAFLGGRDRAVTEAQRIAQASARLKFSSEASARARKAREAAGIAPLPAAK